MARLCRSCCPANLYSILAKDLVDEILNNYNIATLNTINIPIRPRPNFKLIPGLILFSKIRDTLNIDVSPNPIRLLPSFDSEWSLIKDKHGEHPMLAAGFVDSNGVKSALLLEDFIDKEVSQEKQKSRAGQKKHYC